MYVRYNVTLRCTILYHTTLHDTYYTKLNRTWVGAFESDGLSFHRWSLLGISEQQRCTAKTNRHCTPTEKCTGEKRREEIEIQVIGGKKREKL